MDITVFYPLPTAGSVLLRDVQVLTLYRDRQTTARRSSPVPQLQCVGGSAGCRAFVPEVVQCQNKGWDGVDVQVRREASGGQLGQRDEVYGVEYLLRSRAETID